MQQFPALKNFSDQFYPGAVPDDTRTEDWTWIILESYEGRGLADLKSELETVIATKSDAELKKIWQSFSPVYSFPEWHFRDFFKTVLAQINAPATK